MRLGRALLVLVVLFIVLILARECAHPCVRYGEEHTTYVLINHVLYPMQTRECVERAP